METKINIAEILKDKPVGIKLYSSTFGYIKFNGIHKDKVYFYSEDTNLHSIKPNGKIYDDGECVVFPSKEMRDWRKFEWKNGDVLVNSSGFKLLFDRWSNDDYTRFFGKVNILEDSFSYETEKYTLAAKEETLDTLEIEKPEFNDGDIAFADYGNRQDVFIVSDKTGLTEGYSSFISLDLNSLTLSIGCRTTFFKKDLCKLRIATEAEKQQLFSALEKECKRWDSDKKAIVDLKPKWTPKPFDRVITRNDDDDIWTANIFSHMDSHGEYVTIGCVGGYTYCIPYNEDTAKLIGTTNNVEC